MGLVPFDPEMMLRRFIKQVGSWLNLPAPLPVPQSETDSLFKLPLPNPIAQEGARIRETEREVLVEWDLPNCHDVQVFVDNQSLSLKCRMKHQESKGDIRFAYTSQFRQKFMLPAPVKGETAETSYQNGLLTVRIQKELGL